MGKATLGQMNRGFRVNSSQRKNAVPNRVKPRERSELRTTRRPGRLFGSVVSGPEAFQARAREQPPVGDPGWPTEERETNPTSADPPQRCCRDAGVLENDLVAVTAFVGASAHCRCWRR